MTRFVLPNQKIVQADTPFDLEQTIHVPDRGVTDENGDVTIVLVPAHDEVQTIHYPGGVRSLSETERDALGITEVVEQPRPDDTFAFVTEDPAQPGAWVSTQFPPERVKAMLIARAKDRRWQKEVGGIVVAGVPIATDDRSKQMIMGARIAAVADPNFTAEWDAADGQQPVTLSAAQIIAISNAVLEHVAEVFNVYKTVNAGINDGVITDYAAIDAAFASD